MATGRGMQLTRQIGEHLVVAELGRLGYVAAPYAGNVPMYDILAANSRGQAIPIQVKAINGGAWQFNADKFLDIEVVNGNQVVRGAKRLTNPRLLCIFVELKGRGKDEFYLFPLNVLQKYTRRVYKPRGKGSKNPNSVHCAIWPKDLSRYKENWQLLQATLKPFPLRRGGHR